MDRSGVSGGRSVPALWIATTLVALVAGGAITAGLMASLRTHQSAARIARTTLRLIPQAPIASLPPGHPRVRLPSGHRAVASNPQENQVIVNAEHEAEQRPNDIAAWNRYGNLAQRFAMFNPANYAKAREAYSHVLTIDPDDGDALRGIGNVYYDTRQYSNAIDAYRRYLARHPEDGRVRTDLGTMYLSTRNPAEAARQYHIALSGKANFFPAEYNLAVAYLLMNQTARARDAFSRARAIAPDERSRARVDEMIAKVDAAANRMSGRRSDREALRTSDGKAVSQ